MTDSQDYTNVDPVIVDAAPDPKGSQPPMEQSEENTLAMFAHLSILLNLVTGFLGLVPPIIIYFAYKDRSRYVAYQSLQAIIFGVVGAVVALIVAVIVLGNLDTATRGTVDESSAYFALLETVNQYGGTAITLLAIGIIVAVLNQLLIRSGREDQAMMTTLAGLVVVLSILVKQISALFVTIKSLFAL